MHPKLLPAGLTRVFSGLNPEGWQWLKPKLLRHKKKARKSVRDSLPALKEQAAGGVMDTKTEQ